MNNSIKLVNGNKAVNIYAYSAAAFTAVSVILNTIGWTRGYDTEMGEYSVVNKIGTAAGITTFVLTLLLITAAFVVKKNVNLEYGYHLQPDMYESFLGSLSGGLIGAYSLITLFDSAKGIKEIINTVNGYSGYGYGTANIFNYSGKLRSMCANRILENAYITKNVYYWMGVLMFLFGIAFCAYMIIFASFRFKKGNLLAPLGFFPVIWGAICLVRIYFDSKTPLNDPIRIFLQMTVSSVVVFFLIELRCRIGKAQPAFYVASASACALLATSCPLSLLIARIFGVNLVNCDMLFLFTLLSFGAFAFSRLFAVNRKRRRKSAVTEASEEQ